MLFVFPFFGSRLLFVGLMQMMWDISIEGPILKIAYVSSQWQADIKLCGPIEVHWAIWADLLLSQLAPTC